MPRYYCIDIGGSYIKLAVGDGQVLNQVSQKPTPTESLADFLSCVAETVLAGGMHAADRLGISITGSIDASKGTVQAAHLPFLAEVDLATKLQTALGRTLGEAIQHEIIVQNDADCFALAEARFGAGKDRKNVFAIIIGTGIGGAQVYRNQLISGFGGAAGEWGHGPFIQAQDSSSPHHLPHLVCSCGQSGCINTVGGARGLEAIHWFHVQQELDSRQIVDGWISGDAACRQTVLSYISIVSDALAIALNITGAEIVPVGGGMSGASALLSALNSSVQKKVLLPRPEPLLIRGQLGKDGGLWGIYARMLAEEPNS